MKPLTPDDTMVVRGVTLRRDPAREPCFKVVHEHTELHLSLDFAEADESKREMLHRDYNNEVQSIEIAAQTLVDFPDAPWDLRFELARQCWDESRHAAAIIRRLLEIGGRKGEFPIANHEWSVVCMFDTLAARLAIQNRAFEGGSLDSLEGAARMYENAGDTMTAHVHDAIIADELQHVRMANHWLKELGRTNPRATFDIAKAMTELRRMIGLMAPRDDEVSANGLSLANRPTPTLKPETRRDAGFTDSELEVLRDRDRQ